MSDYMKEAERLAQELEQAAFRAGHAAASRAEPRGTDSARAALLAHIQRGAVPEGWKVVPIDPSPGMLDASEAVDWGDEDTRGSCCNQWHRMLAAAPVPDHFRDAAGMVLTTADDASLSKCQARLFDVLVGDDGQAWAEAERYLETARPDLFATLRREAKPAKCDGNHGGPRCADPECWNDTADVRMPDVFMYGVKEPDGGAWMEEVCVSTLKGDIDELVDDLNVGRDDADTRYTPVSLVTTEDAKRYGADCLAVGEAAGYARGMKEAGRDAARYRTIRLLATAERDPLPDYEGDTSSPEAFDASIDHATAALRGEVKP